MATFKNLNALFAHLQKQMQATMNDEVADQVRFEEQRQIEKWVYEPYDPFVYERRRYNNDGLQDLDSMVAVTEIRGNNVVLSVVNIAKGQNEDIYLAPLIEYGDDNGYGEYQYKYNRDGTSWQYLQSRPFTEKTIEALQRTGKHVQAFIEGMKSRGIDVRKR